MRLRDRLLNWLAERIPFLRRLGHEDWQPPKKDDRDEARERMHELSESVARHNRKIHRRR